MHASYAIIAQLILIICSILWHDIVIRWVRIVDMHILRSYNRWRRYRRTVDALNGLSSHELSDLGINRGDINLIAWHSVHKS